MENKNSQIQYFDAIRDELLVSLYSNDHESFEKTFLKLKNKIKPGLIFSENAQKTLYQINSITNRFKKKDAHAFLTKFLKDRARFEIKHPVIIDYNTWKKNLGIDNKTLKILFSTTINFQLSTGCSNYCRRCNEWALPGVRKHFSYNAVIEIAKNLARENNREYALYSASDPLDWECDKHGLNRDITHLIETLSKENLTPAYGLLTKVPKGKGEVFKQLVKKKTNISVSITSLNRERIKNFESQLPFGIDKQHDTDELLIPAGRDEDFLSIKSSITDSYGTEITPDGAFIVTPAFTSALNPTGQKRIPVNRNTKFFIQKMTGTAGLKFDYFQYLPVIDTESKKYTLKYLLDSQIENLLLDNGDYETTQPGMISLKEYFNTFKPEAVNKRKAMLSYVENRFKKKYSENKYLTRFKQYKDFCDQTLVNRHKQKIVMYFLLCIQKYLKQNSCKRTIIYHLRKTEVALNKQITDKTQAVKILKQPDSDTFYLFNQLVSILLNNPDDSFITNLINS